MKFAVPAAIFVLLLVVFSIGLYRDPSYVPSPLIGKPAPEFSLPALRDTDLQVGSADMLGEISLLNVWATWCVGCREEHDALLRIAAESGIPIFGLNWKDDIVKARAWLRELGNPYAATAIDEDGRVAIDWGVYGAPETFLIDRDGTVLYKHIAPITMAVWEEEFLPRIQAARGQVE